MRRCRFWALPQPRPRAPGECRSPRECASPIGSRAGSCLGRQPAAPDCCIDPAVRKSLYLAIDGGWLPVLLGEAKQQRPRGAGVLAQTRLTGLEQAGSPRTGRSEATVSRRNVALMLSPKKSSGFDPGGAAAPSAKQSSA